MKNYWLKLTSQVFWHDKIVVFNILILLLINVITWLLLAQVERAEGIIPWHYTVYFGIDRVGPWWKMVLYPTIGSVVMFINFLLAVGVYHQRRLFAYLVLIITNFIQIILFIQILTLMRFVS